METLQPFLDRLAAINPWWGALVAAVVFLVRSGAVKLPWAVPLLSPPKPSPDAVLVERLQEQVTNSFHLLVEDEGRDADEAYGFLVKQIWEEMEPKHGDQESVGTPAGKGPSG